MKQDAKIEALINQFFGDDGSEDPWTKEPIPDWFTKAAFRFGRIFAPKLTVEDFKNHKARFLGYMAAFMQGVIFQAEDAPKAATPKTKFGRNLNMLVREVAQSGPELMRAVILAAQEMEPAERTEFYDAHGEGMKLGLALQATQRMKDSNTAKMCFFLILARPLIDAKAFGRVGEMFDFYRVIHAAFGRPAAPNPDALASLKVQFSTLCSECGVRFRGRGHPKK